MLAYCKLTYYICTDNKISFIFKNKNMWTKSHSVVTKAVTKEQMWKLLSDVNNWHTWDTDIEFAKMEGTFEQGNRFLLKPKGGPKVNIELIEVVEPLRFTDMTKFPLAKMYGEHAFEDTKDGLKITTTMKVEGILGFLWRKIVAQDIVNALPEEMENQIKLASKL
jgi:Polyketide cyclase / dehydrase and lipid transport